MPAFYNNLFLGAGISCLSAARLSRGDYLVLEAEEKPGGLCRSEKLNGYVFDRTGHLLHLRRPAIRRWVKNLLAGNLLLHRRQAWIFSHGVFTRYPFQANFFGLPPQVATECLLGVLNAHLRRGPRPRHFSGWARAVFGEGVARHFLLAYNRKLWTVPPEELTTEWLDRFVPVPDLERVVRGALEDLADDLGYNACFYYPLKGGIQSLVDALGRGLRISCGRRVVGIDLRRRLVHLEDGELVAFGRLISCLPLVELVKMCQPLPKRVLLAARRLRWASVYNLNLGLRRPAPNHHWVYVPESKYRPYRFGWASNFSPAMAPRGCSNLYLEFSFPGGTRPRPDIWRRWLLEDTRRLGLVGSTAEIDTIQEFVLPYAYVIYDRQRTPAVKTILRFFESHQVFSIGRYGRWQYSSMEDALEEGRRLAARLKT